MTTYKTSENYILSSDTRSQLKFLEKLDQLEKQRKDLEEREMLLKAAKVRSYLIYSEHGLVKKSELALSLVDCLGFTRPSDFSEGFLIIKFLQSRMVWYSDFDLI